MSLGVLNNLSAVYAENNLSNTNNSLSKTLQQLSSGSKINSGADDAAGLSLVDGLQANQSALTQSETNAQEGVGLLQVADGALSQVTSLLNRAVTLATEASNGTLNRHRKMRRPTRNTSRSCRKSPTSARRRLTTRKRFSVAPTLASTPVTHLLRALRKIICTWPNSRLQMSAIPAAPCSISSAYQRVHRFGAKPHDQHSRSAAMPLPKRLVSPSPNGTVPLHRAVTKTCHGHTGAGNLVAAIQRFDWVVANR